MPLLKTVLFFTLLSGISCEKVTFKNVTFHGYSVFTHKFKKVIVASNDLKSELPDALFDALEMKQQNIPILYENCIKDIDDLDELILEENGIEEIQPGAFKNLPRLRLLKLKDNKLKLIKNGIFNLLTVSDLDLSNNKIATIESGAFDNMQHLLNVRLTDNEVTEWNSNWFLNTPLLTRVSLQHNLIQELPPNAFKNLKGVRKYGKVALSLNLIFSYNKIRKLDSDAFKGLQEINNLWLDNNLIETLPADLLKGTVVQSLRIGHNNLTCVEDKSVLKAESVDIDGNPWDCKCLEDIKNWAKETNQTVSYFYSDMNCIAKRIDDKLKNLKNRIDELKINNLDEKDEVEVL